MWRFLSALVAVFVAAPIVLGQISEHANAALVGAVLLLILAGAAWLAWVALRPVADRRAATAPTGVCGLSHPRRQALALALVLGAVALASALAFRHRRRPGATLHRVSPAWPSLLSSSASSFSDWRRTGALLSSVSAPCSLARSPPRAPSAAICPGSTSASSARSRRTRTAPSPSSPSRSFSTASARSAEVPSAHPGDRLCERWLTYSAALAVMSFHAVLALGWWSDEPGLDLAGWVPVGAAMATMAVAVAKECGSDLPRIDAEIAEALRGCDPKRDGSGDAVRQAYRSAATGASVTDLSFDFAGAWLGAGLLSALVLTDGLGAWVSGAEPSGLLAFLVAFAVGGRPWAYRQQAVDRTGAARPEALAVLRVTLELRAGKKAWDGSAAWERLRAFARGWPEGASAAPFDDLVVVGPERLQGAPRRRAGARGRAHEPAAAPVPQASMRGRLAAGAQALLRPAGALGPGQPLGGRTAAHPRAAPRTGPRRARPAGGLQPAPRLESAGWVETRRGGALRGRCRRHHGLPPAPHGRPDTHPGGREKTPSYRPSGPAVSEQRVVRAAGCELREDARRRPRSCGERARRHRGDGPDPERRAPRPARPGCLTRRGPISHRMRVSEKNPCQVGEIAHPTRRDSFIHTLV